MVSEYFHRDWKQQWEVNSERIVNRKVDALMMKVNDRTEEPTVKVKDFGSSRIEPSILWSFEYQ